GARRGAGRAGRSGHGAGARLYTHRVPESCRRRPREHARPGSDDGRGVRAHRARGLRPRQAGQHHRAAEQAHGLRELAGAAGARAAGRDQVDERRGRAAASVIVLYTPWSTPSERKPLPMSLLAVAALLEGEFECRILDGNVEPEPTARILDLARTAEL